MQKELFVCNYQWAHENFAREIQTDKICINRLKFCLEWKQPRLYFIRITKKQPNLCLIFDNCNIQRTICAINLSLNLIRRAWYGWISVSRMNTGCALENQPPISVIWVKTSSTCFATIILVMCFPCLQTRAVCPLRICVLWYWCTHCTIEIWKLHTVFRSTNSKQLTGI